MPLVKDGRLAEDTWVRLTDDAPLPVRGGIIVSLERLLREEDELRMREDGVGVVFGSSEHPELAARQLPWLRLVALEFPSFTDGRAYSYARILKARYGFSGEIRAIGQVLRDQVAFMVRCGFTSFEITDRYSVSDICSAIDEISLTYQGAQDGHARILALRHGDILRRSVA